MSTNFELTAEQREQTGTVVSRRLRRAGKVPAVIYGAGKPAAHITLDHDEILHSLENEAFHAAILNIKTGKDTEQAILRDLQMHPFKPRVVHVDFQRVSATEKMHIKVPIHFLGEEQAPGVKLQHGIVSHQMTEVDIMCLPSQLPEYLEADVSALNLHDSLHLSDLKLPEGVELTQLSHGGDDLAVVTVVAVRGTVEDEEEAEAAEAEAGVEEGGEESAG